MVNAAVLLIVSTHPADSNVSEIKFQFKVKFTHYAEIMQSQGKQCVICNSAYKTQLGILRVHKIKEAVFVKTLFLFPFFIYLFTNLHRKSYKQRQHAIVEILGWVGWGGRQLTSDDSLYLQLR